MQDLEFAGGHSMGFSTSETERLSFGPADVEQRLSSNPAVFHISASVRSLVMCSRAFQR